VFTDGVITDMNKLENEIKSFANWNDMKSHFEFGLLFLYAGKSEKGRLRVKRLDDDLKEIEFKHDIVDTKSIKWIMDWPKPFMKPSLIKIYNNFYFIIKVKSNLY
jgi:hypothetical protein